ncbi:MAG: ABC transporter permease [Candidatus Acidiferrum sp.]
MPLFSKARAFLGNLLSSRRVEADLNEEVRSHLDMLTEENRCAGMSPEEAQRAARIELGCIEQLKEQVREQRLGNWLHSVYSDSRFALRQLRKSPAFTIVAILTLALGIGANTAIFSVINSVLLRSLPFARPSSLVYLSTRSTFFDFPYLGLSFVDLAGVRSSSSSFSTLAVFWPSPKELIIDNKPQRVDATEVTEDFFPVLGLRPLYGRLFTSADMQPGSRSVILSNELWRGSFGASPAAIGKTITLDSAPHTIVGVMPPLPATGFSTDSKLWTAFIPTQEQLTDRGNHTYGVIARLKPHVSIPQAQAELDTISAHLASACPDINKSWTLHATSLNRFLLGDARTPLAILFCAVGFVLLIACANVSNLFLARGWARRREFAIRSAIGASRSALFRQLTVESLLIAFCGAACAFLIAVWTTNSLRATLPPDIPRLDQLRIDAPVALFTMATSLLAALLSGLAPALLTLRSAGSDSVRVSLDRAKQPSPAHNFLRQLLVISEIALAAVLLIGATLALRSFNQLLHLDLGFHPNNVLTLRLDFPKSRFSTDSQAISFIQQILDGVRGTPGVTSSSAGIVFPMSDEVAATTFATEATAVDPAHEQQSSLANRVTPDYFRTLGIPLLAGRDFTDADTKGKSPLFIVNEELARKYFGTVDDSLGKRFSTDFSSVHPVWGQIVGVVGDLRETNHFDPQATPKPEIYAPLYQDKGLAGIYLLLHSDSDSQRLVPALQNRIWSIDKNQPITAVATLNQRIAEVNASPRSQTILLTVFAALGFLLALIGVYGVMSYLVGLQTREIGIRIALGATPTQVLRKVLSHGLKLTLLGIFLGIVAGLLLTRFMNSLLFSVSTNDPITYVSVAVLLILVAVAACYLPARRAARVDPMVALRYE